MPGAAGGSGRAVPDGPPPGEPDRDDDEGPQHTVTIARPFAAGKDRSRSTSGTRA